MPHVCGCVVDNATGYDSYSRCWGTNCSGHTRAARSLPHLGQSWFKQERRPGCSRTASVVSRGDEPLRHGGGAPPPISPWAYPRCRAARARWQERAIVSGPRNATGASETGSNYLTVTEAPAPSRASFAFAAASLLTFSSTVFGAPSTRSLASLRPRLVSVRTSLMTWIFLSPAASRMTSNSSCSSASSAGAAAPAPPAAATATGAAALTSNVSSKDFTNSDSSRRVISLNASSRSALLSFAMIVSLLSLVLGLCVGRFGRGLRRRASLELRAQRVGE